MKNSEVILAASLAGLAIYSCLPSLGSSSGPRRTVVDGYRNETPVALQLVMAAPIYLGIGGVAYLLFSCDS